MPSHLEPQRVCKQLSYEICLIEMNQACCGCEYAEPFSRNDYDSYGSRESASEIEISTSRTPRYRNPSLES
jgi:hypothetical protein